MEESRTKPLSLSEIARDWGVAKQAVHQAFRKHGVKAEDFPDLDAARSWRAAHVRQAPGRARAGKAASAPESPEQGALPPPAAVGERSVSVPAVPQRRVTLVDADGDLDRLVVLQAEAVLQRAFDLFMGATDRGDSTRLAGELRTWADATKAAGAARSSWLENAQAARKLLTVDEVLSVVLPLIQGIRSALVKLGDRVSVAANPANPVLAKQVIDAAVDRIFAQVERVPRSLISDLRPADQPSLLPAGTPADT